MNDDRLSFRDADGRPVDFKRYLADWAGDPSARITYLWNKLHPDRKPEIVRVELIGDPPAPISIMSKDAEPRYAEVLGYLMTECNMTRAEVKALTMPEVVEILRGEVEKRGHRRFGPSEKPGILMWDDEPLKVTPTTWKFLEAIWGKQSVPFEEVGELVWADGEKRKSTIASTIRSRATKVADELHDKYGIDIMLSCAGEHVSIEGEWPS